MVTSALIEIGSIKIHAARAAYLFIKKRPFLHLAEIHELFKCKNEYQPMINFFMHFGDNQQPCRIGIAGTGFIGHGLAALIRASRDFTLGRVLTRRPANACPGFERAELTDSLAELIDQSDIVVECSGDIAHGFQIVQTALQAGKKVVTMASEFHATVGSHFVGQGYLTEGEGDQPGSLAALHEEAVSMGFTPLVYGNIKGYLNHHPTREDMQFWSGKNGISLPQVTSFTDGTKMQIEQVLVANGLGASVLQTGMVGPENLTLQETADLLGPKAEAYGRPVVDYVLNRQLPAGVFIVAKHDVTPPDVLRYFKMGDGPYYVLLRPYHLCHLELMKTLRRTRDGGSILLDNGAKPEVIVASIAKQAFAAGDIIDHPIGSFALRGEAMLISTDPEAVPLGILHGARVKHAVEPGQRLTYADVELPESPLVQAVRRMNERSQ
jgi:predicted homoserine dehydrogenase-like protein